MWELWHRRPQIFLFYCLLTLNSNVLVAVVVVSVIDNGLKAHPSEPPCMSSPCGMGDTDDIIRDDMSGLSMMDETVGFKSTTGRSVWFDGTKDLVMRKLFERQTTVCLM
jgi:hypothetical protein